MKKLAFLMILVLLSLPGIADTTRVEKTILIPADKTSVLNIENLYISPQSHLSPLIAFYGEDEKHIIVYNVESKKAITFEFEASKSAAEPTPVSFVTFCWDQEKYGKFAAIFSTYGKKLVFAGSIEGEEIKKLKRLKPDLGVNTTAFNYRNGILSFLNLDKGRIETSPQEYSLHFRSPYRNKVISDFKLVEKDGKPYPYFTLRDTAQNDNGIYEGRGFNEVVDATGFDELYPHYSPGGNLLGYIERNKQTASARVCLKIGKSTFKKSNFTFALEENAMLREYPRMYFMGNKLYYFIQEPDLNSKNKSYGLFELSEEDEKVLHLEEKFISTKDEVIFILTNIKGFCKRINEFPIIKNIIPFKYKNRTHFVLLTHPAYLKIKIENSKKDEFDYESFIAQVIVISDSRFLMEKR